MAGKGPVDEKLKKAITDVEAHEYKVLTKEEYDHLMKLHVVKNKSTTDASKEPTPPNTSTPHITKPPSNTREKLQMLFPGMSPVPRLQFINTSTAPPPSPQVLNTSYMAPSYNIPKLPFFSGSQEPSKGETSYEVWNFEVKCLQKSKLIPEEVLFQTIRNSLKGSARSILPTLGENASVDDILNKLDGFYGNVSSGETHIQSFYSDYQQDKDSIVEYGSRLEQTISRAIRYGHIDLVAKDAMLRSKFWTGLRSQQLKHSTRHLYDSIKDFQLLLKEVRKVELEESSSTRPPAATSAKHKVTQQQAGQVSNESEDTNSVLLKQMNELMGRMKAMEKKLETQQQSLAAANNQASSQFSNFQPQFTRGRGRGYGRGYDRGYGRGYDRGYGRNYRGRGYQNNYNTENDNQNSFGGRGGFRGGQRGGTNGRGANRGGRGAGGTQPLNC